jgi:hypothetical protein
MMSHPHQPTDCLHIIRPDGIHVFRFKKSTRQAVDEWLRHLDTMFADMSPDASVRYILDYQLGAIPPIAYAANQTRLWLERRTERRPARVAFLHHSHLLVTMLENTVRLLKAEHVVTRFFMQEADAVTWLLEK